MDDIARNTKNKKYENNEEFHKGHFGKTKSSVFFPSMSIEESKKESNNDLNSSFNSENSVSKTKKVDELLSYKDIKNFDPEDFSVRRYNKDNINAGKIFFKYRYIKRKIEELSVKKSVRMSTILNIKNLEDIVHNRLADKRLSLPYFNLNINNSINKNEDMFTDKDDYRNFNSKFLTTVEKSIIHFNLKKYDESFKVLFQEKIIDSEVEFGEFLLVKNGYDKYVLGSFLAKDKPPNKNKEVINGFINSIDLKYYVENSDNNYFLECLRFLLSRLNLPQDANMILQIMDTYSTFLFNNNKDDKDFISKYSSIDAIYLLISTLLALNTMFTRKDIKNMNMITIKQFLDMNKEIEKNEAKDIYEKLEKNPISMSYNYSDIMYQKMTVLVKENSRKNENKENKHSITSWLNDNNFERQSIDFNIIIEEDENVKADEDDNENENLNESESNSFNENINIDDLNKINSRTESTNSIKESNVMRKNNSSLNFNANKFKRKSLFEPNITNQKHFYKVDEDIRQISFSYRENLQTFSDKDISILTTPTKFIKLISKNSHHIRVFVVDGRMDKLKWAKEIEVKVNSDKTTRISKTKGNVHTLEIREIEDVYNGIGKSQLIKDYIKTFPNENKEANNFITIKAATKSFCIKANDQETGLSWFKALKSLIIHHKALNKKNLENKNRIKIVKNKIKNIWRTFVLPNWEKYGNYLFYRAQNKINFSKKQKPIIMTSKNGLLESKTLFSIVTINNFLNEAIKKLKENNYFDYNEFLYFYSLGLPSRIRGKIWTSLIGNPCGININLYKAYSDLIAKIDFSQLFQDYEKNNNIESTLINIKDDINNDKYTISQILLDIISIKDNFLLKDTKEDKNTIFSQVYTITRVFFLMRPDIMYNKSLVAFSFIFILVCKDEYASFYNIFNLICSTNLLHYYKKNENYIDIRVEFFDELLKNRIPKVSLHFKNLDISSELFLVSWFGNIFSFTLDYHLLKRIFDLYLLHGEYILFQVGLTIIKIQEDELLNCTISDVFRVLGRLPDEYKEDIFLEKMYLNNIYIEYEAWKTNRDLEKQKKKFDFNEL